MREETTFFTRKKKLIALFTVLIIFINMFSPYSILLSEVRAATRNPGEPYFSIILPSIDPSRKS